MLFIQRKLLLNSLCFLVLFFCACTQQDQTEYFQTLAAKRLQLNESFFDRTQSPLDSASFKHFTGLKFYPVNPGYKVMAELEPIADTGIFELLHSHQITRPYKFFAKAHFSLMGKKYALMILEQAVKKEGNENYLFIPFTDDTNGDQTYGGGRYIDCVKPGENAPHGNQIEIDFNLAYNPYCAYNDSYFCPIPPKENALPLKVVAGMKYDPSEFGR